MQQSKDIAANQFELLKTLEPYVVCQRIAHIIESQAAPKATTIAFWDNDLENFSREHFYTFGQSTDMGEAISDLIFEQPNFCARADELPELPETFHTSFEGADISVLTHKIMSGEELVAVIFVSGGNGLTSAALQDCLEAYPLSFALTNCWEVSELRKEVDRLRDQYEQLEADFQVQKLQNAQSNHSGNSAFRVEQNDKEKLVYEISNAVRSSLDIEEVLQTAVNKIGSTFGLSRCLVIWPMPDSDDFSVYEFHDPNVLSGKHLFYSEQGAAFVRLASTKTAPHDFMDDSGHEEFDKEFLSAFGFLSGMLVPLIYQDRNIGTLFIQDCLMAREWSIDNTALVGSLADLVTVAIEHANMHDEKKRQAVTDGLTGIANRRHFNDTLLREFERARRYSNSLSLVIVDLDYLKRINDTYGHHVGDEAIKMIGGVLATSCRAVDLAARYGGEEFCLLLPDTVTEDAILLAERVRNAISELDVPGPGHITASIGVATYPEHASQSEELFAKADQALYRAKEGGRNRVMSAEAVALKET